MSTAAQALAETKPDPKPQPEPEQPRRRTPAQAANWMARYCAHLLGAGPAPEPYEEAPPCQPEA